MNFYNGAVQRHRLDLDTDDLSMLQLFEQSIQNTALRPAVHSGVDRMPVAKTLWQAAPFAAMLGNVQNGIENLKIGQADIASLPR